MTGARRIRCAIYTRKSTEEGLEQDFNSLDAQFEACAAYIASQRHEGWPSVAGRYDDGGISGGTLERPALRRLLDDIEAGRVNMVVVYKIDRLTRSLTDFAKLVDRFDAAGCSFVSVTQAFNTASSMGRLTLNVLLSFAQFEREVTAERIRDKIAASKKKGMWMGGLVPLGYDKNPDPRVRGLVVNASEADTVRTIFGLYDAHPCLRTVAAETARLGIRSKRRVFANGRTSGGGILSRGQIHFLLTNPIYIGRIRHRNQSWPGQHAAIIDRDLWDRVQSKLQAASGRPRRRVRKTGTDHRDQPAAPLAGKLRDETGDLLTPTHTTRRGRRYRYYVSNRLVAGKTGAADANGWRLPAQTLERAVAGILHDHIATTAKQKSILSEPDAGAASRLQSSAEALCARLKNNNKLVLRDLVASGRISNGRVTVELAPEALANALEVSEASLAPNVLTVTASFDLRRRGVEARIVAGETMRQPDAVLVQRLAEAHHWIDQLRAGIPLSRISSQSGSSDADIRTRAQLAFLSPAMQAAILEGTQPPELCLARVLCTGVPLDCAEQERIFGIESQVR